MTKTEPYNYYLDQLSRIELDSEYSCTMQIFDPKGNKTKHLSINEDSAKEMIKWLKKNYLNKKKKPLNNCFFEVMKTNKHFMTNIKALQKQYGTLN